MDVQPQPVREMQYMVSDDGQFLLIRVTLENGNDLDLQFPFDMTPMVVDAGGHGMGFGAKIQETRQRFYFELGAFEIGDIDTGPRKGETSLSLFWSKASEIHFIVPDPVGKQLLEGLKRHIEGTGHPVN